MRIRNVLLIQLLGLVVGGSVFAAEPAAMPKMPGMKPLFDYPVRDTSVCVGPDGMYYLTGTTGHPTWWMSNDGIRMWKSRDMKTWAAMGLVWSFEKDGTWQKGQTDKDGKLHRAVWAPELHYFKGTYWIAYSLNYGGTGVLKSESGKPEGPYVDVKKDGPLTGNIDASLFADDDGSVYFVWQNGMIAKMKDDVSGLAEEPRLLKPANEKQVGFEAGFLTKINGKYHLLCADFMKLDGKTTTYDCMAASADSIYGPYGDRYLAIPGGGHNVLFKDAKGLWWSTYFGNDDKAPFKERPAVLRIEIDRSNRIAPVHEETTPAPVEKVITCAVSHELEKPFDGDWKFLRSDAPGADKTEFDDRAWRTLDLPHDWSIEDLPASTAVAAPTLNAVPGPWRFQPGDDAAWKESACDDHTWQQVNLPDTWQHHSNYTQNQVYGWFRRHLEVPVALKGQAAVIALGRVDDVDETYLNGQRIGGTGAFPPAFKTAWDVQRYYPVPAGLLKGDGCDVLAVRVYNQSGEGGITAAGVPDVVIGPFAPSLSAGGGATGHVVGGIGWYRKTFTLSETTRDRKVAIEFDGVYMDSDVWINGVYLGNHPYGYTSFVYDLTPHLAPAGSTNVLAVRVRNQGKNSRWYSGSGIYRHVRLVVTDAARIGHWGVAITTPQVSAGSATVQFAVRVDNGRSAAVDGEIRVRLCQADGKEAATATAPVHVSAGASVTAEKSITLASPQLWSDADPKLYLAEIMLVVGGTEVDRTSVPFGIRSIAFDAEHGFRLNGVTVKLKGACMHHENGPLGSVAIDRAEERRVELLKANGYNAIRCAHNPPSPYFLEACDRLGMLVIDEAFDAWNYGKNTDDYNRYFKDWWQRDIDSLVSRDRNHPCVIMWSVGNEIPEQESPEGAETCAMLAQAVRKIDPTRPVAVANNQATEKSDSYFSAVDVCGYNYHLERYELDHQRLPKRVIYASESFPTQPYDHWKGVMNHAWVIGDFVWSGFDYMGESGGGSCVLDGENEGFPKAWPWYIVNCGDIDLCGFKRVSSYCRDVVWGRSKLEMAVHRPLPPGRLEMTNGWGWPDELRSWTWPGQEGKSMQVRVFTSGDQVRLMLNNKEVGRANVPESSKQISTFQVPYAPGTLRAVALSNGVELASQDFVTTGAPRGIRLTADRSAICADRNDLSFVTVEIVDEDGRPVPDAQVKVRFAVSGPGELAAVGSGDPKGPASFRQPERSTFHGRCLAILRPIAGAGTITLRAESDGLATGSIAVAVR